MDAELKIRLAKIEMALDAAADGLMAIIDLCDSKFDMADNKEDAERIRDFARTIYRSLPREAEAQGGHGLPTYWQILAHKS